MNLLLESTLETRQALLDALGVAALIVEQADNGVFRIVAMNRHTARLFGVPDDTRQLDLTLEGVMEVSGASREVAGAFLERSVASYQIVMDTGESRITETATERADGKIVWARNTIEPIKRDGKIICMLTVNIDVTEVMEAQRDIEDNLQRLIGQVTNVCDSCSRIQSADGRWLSIEELRSETGELAVSHGMCPNCTSRWVVQ